MTILALVGPTASGKTKAAIHLAHRFNAEIVGVDASQVYRGLDIGTGKATPEELQGVPHHLIDVIDPDEPFDAAEYVRRARAVIRHIQVSGKNIILCGGTGLYFRSLLFGLCDAPAVLPVHQERLRRRIAAGDVHALHTELMDVDPRTAQRLSPNDKQRIERALGVFLSTGKPLSVWQDEHGGGTPAFPVHWVGLRWDRNTLWKRIEQRIDGMLAAGWIEEVQSLLEQGYQSQLNSLSALGYRYIVAHLNGELTKEDMTFRTLVATRRYAKRQMTWFKGNDAVQWFDGPVDLEKLEAYVAHLWSDE